MTRPFLPHAMILAGGRATRMGGADKALLPLDGRPILAHLLQRLRPQTARIALNANGPAARFAAFGLPVLADSLPDHPGPLAGVLAAMDWARECGQAQVLVVPGDSPWPPADLTDRLLAARPASGLVVAAVREPQGGLRDHPTFGLWPVSLRDALAGALHDGQGRMRDFLRAHAAGRAVWDAPDPFVNINTPAELRAAQDGHGAV